MEYKTAEYMLKNSVENNYSLRRIERAYSGIYDSAIEHARDLLKPSGKYS